MTKTVAPSLKALAEDKDVDHGVGKLTIFTIDPDVVQFEDGWNGRDEGPDLDAYRARLKAAMKAGAFVPPIDIQMVDGEPVVRDGHSRTIVARELKAEGTPYTLQARQIRGNDAEMRYHMLGSASGRSLTPLEQGRQFLLLTRMGETVAQIATRLGQHRSTVENGLQLAEMPASVQKMVAAGKVASHTALKTVKGHGADAPTVLKAAMAAAEAKGKKKATGKNIAPSPKVTKAAPSPAPAPRGQTLPPVNETPLPVPAVKTHAQHFELVNRLASVNISIPVLDRLQVINLVRDARKLLGIV